MLFYDRIVKQKVEKSASLKGKDNEIIQENIVKSL